MPILANGSNVTLMVAPGQILTVQSDQSTYDFESPVGTRVGEYAYDNVFGPFTASNSVKLTSVQGPLFYDLTTPAATRNIQFNPPAIFQDDFRRATTTAGTLGGGWTLKGAYAGSYPLPAATGGEVGTYGFTNASGTVVYATRTLRKTPRQLQCRWLLHDNTTGTDYTTLGLIISSSTNLIDTMLHVTITPFALNFQKRISGGAFIDLVPQVGISSQLAFDVPHIATVTVDGTTARVQIDEVVDVTVTDVDIATITGPNIVAEHFSPSTNVRYPMTIYEVLVR